MGLVYLFIYIYYLFNKKNLQERIEYLLKLQLFYP